MKKGLFIIVLLMSMNLVTMDSNVFAKEIIEINEIKIDRVHQDKNRLTNTPIELNGPYAETNFYYTLNSALEGGEHYVHLEMSTSSLLVAPSSLTVKVNGEPMYTESLTGEGSITIRLDLKGSALEEGNHTITVAFSGIIREGVCTPQNTTGNWVVLQPDSYISIGSIENMMSSSLVNYPELYAGNEDNIVSVVIPKSHSDETLQSALIVASYLSSLSESETLQVVSENELKSIRGNIVIVGEIHEFETVWIDELMTNELEEVNEDSLYLFQKLLKQDDLYVSTLVVTASNGKAMLEKIPVLTSNQMIEQFTGEKLEIDELPADFSSARSTNTLTFEDFFINDVMFDRNYTMSPIYYGYLPVHKNLIDFPTVELTMKRSDSIKVESESTDEFSSIKGIVELIVYINNVPHSVDVHSLEEDMYGNLQVEIPFDKEILPENRLVTLQLDTSGLKIDNPCIVRDNTHWLYISNESKINLPVTSGDYELSLGSFPFPFSERGEELVLVLPDEQISYQDLLQLFEVLTINSQVPKISMLRSSEVSEADLQHGNIIFVGSTLEHQLLEEVAESLTVSFKSHQPQLASKGFITDGINYYSFMQKNPWNENYYLLVLDSLHAEQGYFSRELLSYLADNQNDASVAVQSGPNRFYTNSLKFEKDLTKENVEIESTNTPEQELGLVIAFIVILLVVIGLIFVYVKKRKK